MAKIALTLVTDKEGNILLIKRAKGDSQAGIWETPGGHIDKGESSYAAAIRETQEEVGLKVLLLPGSYDIQTPKGIAKFYHGLVYPRSTKPRVRLNPKEHTAFKWVSPSELKNITPLHKDFRQNVLRLLKSVREKIIKEIEGSTMTTRRSYKEPRTIRTLENSAELKEAILVGDEVEIFLARNADPKRQDNKIEGIVDRRNRNFIWIREHTEDQPKPIPTDWFDKGPWQVVRIFRNGQEIKFQKGNPYDPDSKDIKRAKGLALILEPEEYPAYDSVSRTLRGDTPDLDYSMGQAPKSLEVVAPRSTTYPVLRNVRQTLTGYGLEPDTIEMGTKGRILILTQDSDTRRKIMQVLKDQASEIKSVKAGLYFKPRKAAAINPGNQTPGLGVQPEVKVTLPNQQQQIKNIQQQTGGQPQVTPDGIEFTFDDPAALQNLTQKKAQRQARIKILARRLRSAFGEGNLTRAASSLEKLTQEAIKPRSLAAANLARSQTWKELELYLTQSGEIRQANVARQASLLARTR